MKQMWIVLCLVACGEIDNKLPEPEPSLALNEAYMEDADAKLDRLASNQEEIENRLDQLLEEIEKDRGETDQSLSELKKIQFLNRFYSLRLVNPCQEFEKYYVQLSYQLVASPTAVLKKGREDSFELYDNTFLVPGSYRYNSCSFEVKEVMTSLLDWQREILGVETYQISLLEICSGMDGSFCTTVLEED